MGWISVTVSANPLALIHLITLPISSTYDMVPKRRLPRGATSAPRHPRPNSTAAIGSTAYMLTLATGPEAQTGSWGYFGPPPAPTKFDRGNWLYGLYACTCNRSRSAHYLVGLLRPPANPDQIRLRQYVLRPTRLHLLQVPKRQLARGATSAPRHPRPNSTAAICSMGPAVLGISTAML